jgi:hypothetical protein
MYVIMISGKNKIQAILEELMANNFSKLTKDIKPQVQFLHNPRRGN